jgi:hypothetical protein
MALIDDVNRWYDNLSKEEKSIIHSKYSSNYYKINSVNIFRNQGKSAAYTEFLKEEKIRTSTVINISEINLNFLIDNVITRVTDLNEEILNVNFMGMGVEIERGEYFEILLEKVIKEELKELKQKKEEKNSTPDINEI